MRAVYLGCIAVAVAMGLVGSSASTEPHIASLPMGEATMQVPWSGPTEEAESEAAHQPDLSDSGTVRGTAQFIPEYDTHPIVAESGPVAPIDPDWRTLAQLTEAQMDRVMELADVPVEWRADMKAIAWCESKYSPGAVGDAGASRGIMQLAALWFAYAGEDPEAWMDPVVNMRAALGAVRYDIARGYDLYRQWTCQP